MTTPGENCDRHESEISRLRDRAEDLANSVHEKEAAIVALQRDQVALADRIPPGLGQWMGAMDQNLKNMNTNLGAITEALQRGYVTVAEFDGVKNALSTFATKVELEPIKSAFYKGLGLVLTLIVTGLLALLFQLGGK